MAYIVTINVHINNNHLFTDALGEILKNLG
jgi:hypothetical protein